MLTSDPGISLVLTLIAVMALIWLLIAWILLPFLLMGIKPLIREAILRQDATNKLLQALLDHQFQAPSHATTPERTQDPDA